MANQSLSLHRGRTWRVLAANTVVFVAYVVAGKLGLGLAAVHPSATAVWPPTGIALAAILLGGRGCAPGVFLGAFVVNATTFGTVASSLAIATGNTLEAVLGAAFAHRFARGRRAFHRADDALRMMLGCCLGATAIAATVGTLTLVVGDLAPAVDAGSIWLTWWLGDAAGALLVAPVIVSWAGARRQARAWEVAEFVVLVAGLVAIWWIVFVGPASRVGAQPLAFACLPFLVWAATRFGPREAATATLLLAGLSTAATWSGHGPFAAGNVGDSLLLLEAFLFTTAGMTLVLAGAVEQRRTVERQLRRTHEDLEQIAYVVAHDLREPVRGLALSLDMVREAAADRLDPDDARLLVLAEEDARRLAELLDAMLAHARAGAGRPLAPVRAAAALDRAVLALRAAIEESDAKVTHDELPVVTADETGLTQVFQNLVANALKYRSDDPPRVHVDVMAVSGDWVFRVRDNGTGIDSRHAVEVFEPFRRLDSTSHRPGVGIGLAVCRRVIERHGGRIWLEPAPGGGTTVSFTLPMS